MQFVNDDNHYLNPRFSSELGFLNKPVFEMQQKLYSLNKAIGSKGSLTDKERLKLYEEKIGISADFKQQMKWEIRNNSPELELQGRYAIDVPLSDQVCNEIGIWCEKQPQKDLAAAEHKASLAMQDSRINWYHEMFGKETMSQAKAVEKNKSEIDFDKE